MGDIVLTHQTLVKGRVANPFLGYMGPSSSWAFCRRVLSLVGKHLPNADCEPPPWHLDGSAFRMQRRLLGPDEVPDVSNLPPADFALFLIKTAMFYLGPLANIIDEQDFLRQMRELYEDAPAKARRCTHWYSLFLLMLAFGKAFMGNGARDDKPPGYHYAARAMTMLPDMASVDYEPVISAQALTLAALYYQSVDMRVAAFHHVSAVCVSHVDVTNPVH
jgi:proline utilization trans-activator